MQDLVAELRRHHAFWHAFLVGIGAFLLVAVTIDDPGLVWDEPFSIVPSINHIDWLRGLSRESFTREGIFRGWRSNCEHPPFAKLLIGVFREGLSGVVGVLVASRLATACCFGLLIALLFRFMQEHFGARPGLFAVLSLVLMPRFFGHAHFATLDVTMSLTWVLTVWAFVKGLESWKWSLATGLLYGVALLTKINSVLIPWPLLAWGLLYHRKKVLRNLLAMCIISPLVFWCGWPWLWQDGLLKLFGHPTFGALCDAIWQGLREGRMPQLSGYIGTGAGRAVVATYYLGTFYRNSVAPWHFPLVMMLFTTPIVALAAAAHQVGASLKHWRDRPIDALILANLVMIMGIMVLPGVSKYDGVRLFLPAFPFLAALTGLGIERWWQWGRRHWPERVAPRAGLLSIIFLSQAVPLALIHPYELSYYNALAGGLRGADKMGLEATYWGDSCSQEVLDYLNATCPSGSRVAFHRAGEFADRMYAMLVRRGIEVVSFGHEYDYLVLIPRLSMLDEGAWEYRQQQRPLYEVRRQGVFLCGVYRALRR